MPSHGSLLLDLEAAVTQGSPERRAETLEQITSLFLRQSDRLSDQQVALFGEVFERLIGMIETRSLAALARSLVSARTAPRDVMVRLAGDDNIAVAGPVLERSPQLCEDDLVGIARVAGQEHLLAISGRNGIGSGVTDILLQRGNRAVAVGVATNATASFSEPGYAALVKRTADDGQLAEYVSLRADLPLPLFHRLVAQAAEVVQQRLLAIAAPERRAEIRRVLAKVAEDMGGPRRRDYAAAKARICELQAAGKLDQEALTALVKTGVCEDAFAALAALCDVPVETVDRLAAAGKADPILILCKAAGCKPATMLGLVALQFGPAGPEPKAATAQFEQLSANTAQRIVHFWRSRAAA